MKFIPACILATLTLAIGVPSTAPASEGHGHGHGHDTTKPKITIPDSLADLWKAIQTGHAALASAIAKKDGQAAHDTIEKLLAYLAALPQKTVNLDAEARKRIEGQAKNLSRAYDATHHATDDSLWEKAAAEMKKAEGGIKLIATQMPGAASTSSNQ